MAFPMPPGAAAEDGPPPSIATSLPNQGGPTGLRKRLGEAGITYALLYTNDTLSNLKGGSRRGTINQGKLEGSLTIDLERLAGWEGLTLFANAFQLHNTGRIRRDYVDGINSIANIEATPTTRLSELWLERRFGDHASLRVGQVAADTEFFFSSIGTLFLQSDWPTIAAVSLPSGGPAYPLSTPGVRVKFDPLKDLSLLLAVFNGDPAGPGPGDEQLRNRHGLNFRLRDPALIIGEAQFRFNQGKDDRGLAGTIKFGGWVHLGEFDDQRLADDGSLLADPTGSGVAAKRRGNHGVYAVVDQQIYRPAGGGPDSGITLFGRVSAAPSDRNLIDAYVDGGIVFNGLIASRPNDSFGLGFIYARFSESARAFDRDTVMFTGAALPIRDYEANLELTYQAQVIPGWTIQPTLQHIWHPSGDASRNALVAGVRSVWRY